MKTKKIVHISDTHFGHGSIKLPYGDILIHTGDALYRGTLQELVQFANWFKAQPHEHKIFIPGNHDAVFEEDTGLAISEMGPDIHVLINEGVEIYGKKFWGSPYTPMFNNWHFMRYRGPHIKEIWDNIPEDTDVLLTHGPPHGILDLTRSGENAGCEELAKRVLEVKPEIHLFGHIHESRGQQHLNGISYYNGVFWLPLPGDEPHTIELIVEEE